MAGGSERSSSQGHLDLSLLALVGESTPQESRQRRMGIVRMHSSALFVQGSLSPVLMVRSRLFVQLTGYWSEYLDPA